MKNRRRLFLLLLGTCLVADGADGQAIRNTQRDLPQMLTGIAKDMQLVPAFGESALLLVGLPSDDRPRGCSPQARGEALVFFPTDLATNGAVAVRADWYDGDRRCGEGGRTVGEIAARLRAAAIAIDTPALASFALAGELARFDAEAVSVNQPEYGVIATFLGIFAVIAAAVSGNADGVAPPASRLAAMAALGDGVLAEYRRVWVDAVSRRRRENATGWAVGGAAVGGIVILSLLSGGTWR